MIKTIKYQYLTIFWGIFILIMCNLNIDSEIAGPHFFFDGFDKLAHTGFFFVLSIFLFYGRIRQKNTYSYRIGTIITVLILCIVFGGGVELMQKYFSTYRAAEWWDFFCDLLGCCMGIFSYVLLHQMKSAEIARTPATNS